MPGCLGGDRNASTAETDRVPAPAFFVTSAVFHYLGPLFAVLLFARIDVLGVAWLRIASAAVIFAAWRRPWRVWAASSWRQRRLLLALGAVLGVMNSAFYLAIDRLPLGTVGAIEFLGPVLLAAVGVRTRRNLAALLLAVAGVYLLTDVHLAAEPVGLALAFANCALSMAYVVLGRSPRDRPPEPAAPPPVAQSLGSHRRRLTVSIGADTRHPAAQGWQESLIEFLPVQRRSANGTQTAARPGVEVPGPDGDHAGDRGELEIGPTTVSRTPVLQARWTRGAARRGVRGRLAS